jgi:hypothetical protein
LLLEVIWNYACSKFWESYTSPAAQIRVKSISQRLLAETKKYLSIFAEAAFLDLSKLKIKGKQEIFVKPLAARLLT